MKDNFPIKWSEVDAEHRLRKKTICDGLHDLVLFAQFEKREKHPSRSVIKACNFSKRDFPP